MLLPPIKLIVTCIITFLNLTNAVFILAFNSIMQKSTCMYDNSNKRSASNTHSFQYTLYDWVKFMWVSYIVWIPYLFGGPISQNIETNMNFNQSQRIYRKEYVREYVTSIPLVIMMNITMTIMMMMI